MSLRPSILLLGTILALIPPSFGNPPSCPTLPSSVEVRPGQVVRLDNVGIELAARYGAASGALELDLFVQRLRESDRQPLRTSAVPRLDVTYRLSDQDGLIDAGRLAPRFPGGGPAYGRSFSAIGPDHDSALNLAVVIDAGPGAGELPACPQLPLSLAFRLEPETIVTEPPAEAAGGGSPGVRMEVVGTSDPAGPDGSNNYSDVWGYNDGATFLAIIGELSGTYFLDVTDPSSPSTVGFISGPFSPWRDIKTYQNYVYIVTEGSGSGQGMQIVDVSDPLSPTLVNTYTSTFITAHNIYIEEDLGQAWAVGTNAGSRILDLSDPVNPVEIGSFASPYVHDAYVDGNLTYLSQINSGTHRLADATNPTSLQNLHVIPTPSNFTHNSWANESQTVMATTDEASVGGHVAVYDITDKTNPVLLSEYNPAPTGVVHNVMFDDDDNDTVAISYYALGVKYIDLHEPSIPIELGSYDTYPFGNTGFNGVWGVYAFDPRGYIYGSDRADGLYILDYTPTGATLSGAVTDDATGEPVVGASVAVLSSGILLESSDSGRFASYVDSGTVVLRVSAPGYLTKQFVAGEIGPGQRVDADVALVPLPEVVLSGIVRRADTLDTIAGARIEIVGTAIGTISAPDGTFVLSEVPVGQRIVTAEAFGFASQEARVVLGGASSGNVDLLLESALFVEDAETDQNWIPSIGVGGTGTGSWERVDPNGTFGPGGAVQPEDDHSPAPGTVAFITEQSSPGAGPEDADVDGAQKILTSPGIDLSGSGVAQLRYHRWFSNNAGIFQGGALQVEMSGDGINFVPVETLTQTAASWIRRQWDVGSFVPLGSNFKVRFIATPGFDEALEVLECGVDDVDIVPQCLARFNDAAPDSDLDGTVDPCDGCPNDSADDIDGDGICGDVDNAPFTASLDVTDADADAVGDVIDNCLGVANTSQADLDQDGTGDACDDDVDDDGLPNASDPDDDNDGILDAFDGCPLVPDTAQQDSDSDGVGDACDPDDLIVSGLVVDGSLLVWQREEVATGYNVYRGELGAEVLLPLSQCRASGLGTPYFVDLDLPNPGDGYLYLVTAVSGASEGPLGLKSDGFPRTIDSVCP